MSIPTEPVPPPSAAASEPEGGTTRYSVPEVARRLGISERAVRKRITVGTLTAHKEQGAWVVLLPATMGAVPPDPAVLEAVPEHGITAQEGGTGAPAVDLAPLVAHLERKDDEIRRLSEAAMAWQFRALRAEERLAQLEPGPIAAVDQNAQDMPQARDPGPVRDDRPAEASQTFEPVSDTLGLVWRRWWRRVRGGRMWL
jgi:hypothetical protein